MKLSLSFFFLLSIVPALALRGNKVDNHGDNPAEHRALGADEYKDLVKLMFETFPLSGVHITECRNVLGGYGLVTYSPEDSRCTEEDYITCVKEDKIDVEKLLEEGVCRSINTGDSDDACECELGDAVGIAVLIEATSTSRIYLCCDKM